MIGKIGGKEYECLLDTGATKSIISPEVYLNHPHRNDLALRECKDRLVSIDKSPVAVRGEVELEVDMCGTILVGHFMIAEIADDVVLGIGLQRAGGIMVNHHTRQVEFEGGKTVPYISQRISGLSKCCKVLADRTVVIPPRKEILNTGYICGRTRELERVRGSGLVEPSWKGKMGQRGVMVGKAMDALGGSKWFCTLDLASCYWQVGMSKSTQEKSAFITSGGLYSWKVMPFGLSTAPGTFERLMETVLAGLQWETCLIYLDDVIVFGKTEQQTLDRLDAILSRIGQAGMKLKPSKCRLFQKRVHYLGHVVTEDGVMTDPEKIETVREWPVPTTQTEVRSFLGTASYYRRFVQNFGTIARPLHRLTEKNRPFLWTTECQVAFETLRKKLVEAPVLAYPSSEADFILDTDASATGMVRYCSRCRTA